MGDMVLGRAIDVPDVNEGQKTIPLLQIFKAACEVVIKVNSEETPLKRLALRIGQGCNIWFGEIVDGKIIKSSGRKTQGLIVPQYIETFDENIELHER